eukprot:96404-Prymnesium_polylepis.1
MILGFVGFLLVRVCVTLGCLSTPLCGMNDKKKLVIKALRAPSKERDHGQDSNCLTKWTPQSQSTRTGHVHDHGQWYMLFDICKSVQECSVSVVDGAGMAAIGEVGSGIEELRCNECQTGETGISEWTRPERRPLTHHPFTGTRCNSTLRLPALEPMKKGRVLLYHGKVAVESTGTPGVSWDLVYSINTWVVLHRLGRGCVGNVWCGGGVRWWGVVVRCGGEVW